MLVGPSTGSGTLAVTAGSGALVVTMGSETFVAAGVEPVETPLGDIGFVVCAGLF